MNPTPVVRSRYRAALAAGAVTVLAGSLLTLAPGPAEAAGRADLRVTRASVDKTSVVEGAKVTVTHVVQNRGRRKAGPSTTRVYLTKDVAASLEARRTSRTNPRSALTDLRLVGKAAVKAIAPGAKRSIGTTQFTVPAGVPAGAYRVLVCADDYGKVRETEEGNNCTAASKALSIAEAPGSDGLSVQTFADTYAWPGNEQSSLSFLKIFCNSTHPVKRLTLAAALTSARAFLDSAAPGGVADLRSSGQASTPEKAQELAATALAGGSPGLALAALLEAHRLQPSRGAHLVNAAALATSVGLPNEAIAFLDAAVGRDFLRTPLGIPPEATAAVIRGQALVMTGRLDAAQPLFVSAKQLAPLLSEADAGLATVAACKGKDAIAKRYIRRSRVRTDEPVPPTPPTEDPVQPEPDIDLTRGEAVPLRQLPIAETPAQAAKMRPVYWGIAEDFQAEIQANIAEANRLEQHLRDTDDARTRAEKDRRDSILVLLYRTHLEGEVETAQDALYEEIDKLTEIKEEFWGGGTGEVPYTYGKLSEDAWAACEGSDVPNCFEIEINRTCRPALNSAHIRWRTTILEAQDRANHYFEVWSKRMTGYAANLIDEEAHQLALNHIDGLERDVYALLVQQAQFWSHNVNLFKDHCVDPVPADVLNPPANVDVQSPGACEAGLKNLSLKASLGPTSLKVSCERIEQSFSAEIIPLLHVFVDVKFDFRTGNVSFWAGSKGGGKVGNVVDAGFKSGIYVKVNQQGELVDTGWRVGPNVKVVGGNAEFTAYKDEIDLSFTSSLTPGY
ncbi:CARDB domain-containing protein [Nocardioides pelophilus]|uniref:CARDB domain-containing protein n=1 Tax=Nocardioides pelophilus TaxID=2172019 RepID=UPI0015FF6ACC|nr:CARDB domain-containing protein [Nocardioides pelophilus]